MSIAIAQLRPAAATPEDNERRILAAIVGARQAGARLLVTSAAALGGHFEAGDDRRADPLPALRRLARQAKGIAVVVGVGAASALSASPRLALLQAGKVRHDPIACTDPPVAVLEAEALHFPQTLRTACDAGARIVVASAAHPYAPGVHRERERALARIAREFGVDLVWVNSLGGDGAHVYDGGSFAVSAAGKRLQQLPAWEPTLALLALAERSTPIRGDISHDEGLHAYFAVREALLAALAERPATSILVEAEDVRAASLAAGVVADVRSGIGEHRRATADGALRLRLRVAGAEEAAFAIRSDGGLSTVTLAEPLLRAAAGFRADLGAAAPGGTGGAMALPLAVR